MNETPAPKNRLTRGLRLKLLITVIGWLIFVLGVNPGLFGMDRSPVVGFVQIAFFLVGLAVICLGGFLTMNTLWAGREKTIVADIGYRIVATGFVIAAASGMADVFGFGSQPFPSTPYFGQWQALGVILGEIFIVVGFIMTIPQPNKKPAPA